MKTFVFDVNNNFDVGIPREAKHSNRRRRCIECKKVLSMYNHGNKCFAHMVMEEDEALKIIRRVSQKQRSLDEVRKVRQWMQTY